MYETILSQWEKYDRFPNGLINFDDQLYTKENLAKIASFFEVKQLIGIFQLFIKNYKLWRSGMPDLFLWKE